MLTHFERKVLLIIRNFAHTKKEITMKELSVRTGKKSVDIEKVLNHLLHKGYISWDPNVPDEISLQSWPPKKA